MSPRLQPGDTRVAAHHLPVGQHVGAADVEAPIHLARNGGRTDQVVQNVADRDGLYARVEPARCDHDGHPLGQVTQHFKGRGPRPENDCRAQHHGGHPAGQEDLADFLAGLQVRAQRLRIRVEAAEVDDPADPAALRRRDEVLGIGPVPRVEAGTCSHRVDEVVRHVHTTERGRQGARVRRVTLDDVHLVVPLTVHQIPWPPRHGAHTQARRQKLGDQTPSDVSGDPADKHERMPPVRRLHHQALDSGDGPAGYPPGPLADPQLKSLAGQGACRPPSALSGLRLVESSRCNRRPSKVCPDAV